AAGFRTSSSDEADAIGRGIASRSPILICGSSRARHHYDPDTLEARLGAPAWNLGRDGQFGPFFPYGVAELALRAYAPRLWILEVDESMFVGHDAMAPLNVLLPYAGENADVAELVNHRSRYERLKRLSAIYPFNSLVLSLFASHPGRSQPSRRGFDPVEGHLSPADTVAERGPGDRDDAHGAANGHDQAAPEPAPDALKRRYLAKMIRDLGARGVTVVAIRSPSFARGPADRERERLEGERLARVFTSFGVRFIDLSAASCPALGDPGLFRDTSHLNRAGAARFSALVADSIASLQLPGLRGAE
ncbi:MAG: hypothetical protein ACRDL7_11520, partial [Gaiellaceae bacterium]